MLHGTQHTAPGLGLTTPNTLPVRSAARFAPSCSRDVAHESRSAEAEALAWASVHGGGGAASPRGARAPQKTKKKGKNVVVNEAKKCEEDKAQQNIF